MPAACPVASTIRWARGRCNIYRNGVDTIYRLHGTREYWSIGQAVSSGCVRLINQDVIDLYSRVSVGTPIIVNG